jgi:copper homeostasis protein CutC
MKRFKKMTEKEYKKIKALYNAGITNKQMQELKLSTRSDFTMSMIKKSDNYEDYRKKVAETVAKTKKAREKKTATNGVAVKETSELQFSTQIIELLAQINKRLSTIEDFVIRAQEDKAKHKGFFG